MNTGLGSGGNRIFLLVFEMSKDAKKGAEDLKPLLLSNRAGTFPASSSLGYVYAHEARVPCRCFTNSDIIQPYR